MKGENFYRLDLVTESDLRQLGLLTHYRNNDPWLNKFWLTQEQLAWDAWIYKKDKNSPHRIPKSWIAI